MEIRWTICLLNINLKTLLKLTLHLNITKSNTHTNTQQERERGSDEYSIVVICKDATTVIFCSDNVWYKLMFPRYSKSIEASSSGPLGVKLLADRLFNDYKPLNDCELGISWRINTEQSP